MEVFLNILHTFILLRSIVIMHICRHLDLQLSLS